MRTQKAKGIEALHTSGWNVPEYVVADNPEAIRMGWTAINSYYGKVFCRPCPVTPQHGFEESIVASSAEEAIECFQRALKRDPQAEMIIMPALEADYNVIWRTGLMAVGKGHDGATSGRESISLPLVVTQMDSTLLETAGVTETPYIEAVWLDHEQKLMTKQYPYYTQLRNGPFVPDGENFIPEEIVVQRVVKAEGDLPEFRTLCEGLPRGTVVWHPGGNLGTHYSVHCVQTGIPIVITFEPKVGEKLIPTPAIEEKDLKEVLRGIQVGTAYPITAPEYTSIITSIIFSLHNSVKLSGKAGFFIGAAAVLMHRVGTAASLGEARHAGGRGRKKTRDQIYVETFGNFFVARRKLVRATELFYKHPWQSGYGGKKWAGCAESVIGLDRAIQQTVRNPSQETVGGLITALNDAVNKAHNNGWWLNKFCEAAWFDLGSKGDPKAAILASKLLYKLWGFGPIEGEFKWTRTRRLRVENIRPKVKVVKVLGMMKTMLTAGRIYYQLSGNHKPMVKSLVVDLTEFTPAKPPSDALKILGRAWLGKSADSLLFDVDVVETEGTIAFYHNGVKLAEIERDYE